MLVILKTMFPHALAAEEPNGVVTLRSDLLEVTVSRSTGAILSAVRREEGLPLLQACFDRYELTGEDETVAADERADQVLSTRHASASTVSFACRNPALERLGIALTKRYTLEEGTEGWVREVSFHHHGPSGFFVEAWTHVTLEPEFRAGGYYYVPYGHSLPRLPAEQVTADTPLYSSVYLFINTAAAALIHPGQRLGVASYLCTTNGRYTSWGFGSNTPEEVPRYNPVATPTGWRHYAHRDYLRPGAESSYGVRYSLFRGDSTALLRQYLTTQERRELMSPYPAPAWVKDVKLMLFVTQAYHFDDERIALWKELAVSLGGGYLMPMFDRWGHASGDYPVEDEETERLRRTVERLQREIPTAKVGTYVILVLGEKTETYQQHPDWAVRDRQGQSPIADFPGRFPPQLAREEVRQHYREGILAVVNKLGLDYLYVDGGDGGACGPADWSNRRVGHFTDGYTLMRSLVDELKDPRKAAAAGRVTDHGSHLTPHETGVFFNQPASILADCGFLEMGGGQWSDEGDWRSVSDACYFAKLATRYRPGTWVSHLYPYDLRKYFSMMLALALRPNSSPVNREQLDEFLAKWLPYVNAAYELKDAQLLDAPVSPNWRLETTDWDAFALQQGDALLLTGINHGPAASEQTLSVDRRETTLFPNTSSSDARPLFIWKLSMADPETRPPDEPALRPVSFEVLEKPATTIRVAVRGERNLAQIVTVSAIPAWVAAVDGSRTQCRLTETLGVRITGRWQKKRSELRVEAAKPCEVMVYRPKQEGQKTVVRIGKGEVAFREVEEAGETFIVVNVPAGTHRVSVGGVP